MSDPILENIRNARTHLLKEHGGFDGVLKFAKKLEQSHLKRQKAAAAKKKTTKKKKPSP